MGGGGEALMNNLPKGRPLAIDATARSASPTEPAFIARPDGAPVYYGFVVLDDVNVDGFTLGKITGYDDYRENIRSISQVHDEVSPCRPQCCRCFY
jgi:hypothetical protein